MNKVITNTKKYLISCILVLTSASLFSQTDSSYTWDYNLPGEAWKDWNTINEVWMKTLYPSCLKENNLKMSCAKCQYIYIDAGFSIDNSGKLVDIKILKENICSQKASDKLKACFFNYFKNLVYPKSLWSRKINVKLGTGLSC